jgi:hypothetical protein
MRAREWNAARDLIESKLPTTHLKPSKLDTHDHLGNQIPRKSRDWPKQRLFESQRDKIPAKYPSRLTDPYGPPGPFPYVVGDEEHLNPSFDSQHNVKMKQSTHLGQGVGNSSIKDIFFRKHHAIRDGGSLSSRGELTENIIALGDTMPTPLRHGKVRRWNVHDELKYLPSKRDTGDTGGIVPASLKGGMFRCM